MTKKKYQLHINEAELTKPQLTCELGQYWQPEDESAASLLGFDSGRTNKAELWVKASKNYFQVSSSSGQTECYFLDRVKPCSNTSYWFQFRGLRNLSGKGNT